MIPLYGFCIGGNLYFIPDISLVYRKTRSELLVWLQPSDMCEVQLREETVILLWSGITGITSYLPIVLNMLLIRLDRAQHSVQDRWYHYGNDTIIQIFPTSTLRHCQWQNSRKIIQVRLWWISLHCFCSSLLRPNNVSPVQYLYVTMEIFINNLVNFLFSSNVSGNTWPAMEWLNILTKICSHWDNQ